MASKTDKEKVTEGEIVDDNNKEEIKIKIERRRLSGGRFFWGMLFIILGSMFVIENLMPSVNLHQNIVPILMILLGVTFIFRSII